jgi:hypothetical protein
MIPKEFFSLCEALDGILEREGYGHMRFALLIWDQQGDAPTCTASNDASTSRVLRMLEASCERIKEIDPFIQPFGDGNAGHA